MSTKTSAQLGRRTPLSLSGSVTKNNPNKGSSNNAANGGGNSANGHTTSNANKQDNKFQQQKNEMQAANNVDAKENPGKRQQPQADKKQQQNDNKKANEKNQNGVNCNKQQQSNENKQHQQNKDKQQQQQHQNGNDDNNVNEKDKKEKLEKSEKLDKQQEKSEKGDVKLKEDQKVDQEINDNKKEEKKTKEVKDDKEAKKDGSSKSDAKTGQQNQIKINDKMDENVQKAEEKAKNMDILEEPEQQVQQKASTPVTPRSSNRVNKTMTPLNKTPIKINEKTPQKSVLTNSSSKAAVVTKREITTTIDDNDIEMEPLAVESSPLKSTQPEVVANINTAPAATSTPGKIPFPKFNSGVTTSDPQLSTQKLERPRTFSQISGRKSIRPISDFTPSKLQNKMQYRESYRRINTELDFSNTSMNVTVGSEIPSNFSFSFFGRGRKRDHTPPRNSQSAIGEFQTEMGISPPKKARLDMFDIFSVVSSPISLLRSRFSKASLKSSTPVKMQQKLNTAEDEIEVQNVSGVSVEDEISKSDKEHDETNTTVNDLGTDNDAAMEGEGKENKLKAGIAKSTSVKGESDIKETQSEKTCGVEQTCETSDIKVTETLLQTAVGDPLVKNKKCIIM